MQRRAVVSGMAMTVLRIVAALAGGMLLNLTMPESAELLPAMAAPMPAAAGLYRGIDRLGGRDIAAGAEDCGDCAGFDDFTALAGRVRLAALSAAPAVPRRTMFAWLNANQQ